MQAGNSAKAEGFPVPLDARRTVQHQARSRCFVLMPDPILYLAYFVVRKRLRLSGADFIFGLAPHLIG